MLHRIFILLLVCLQAVQVYSQDSLRYHSKFQFTPSIGSFTPLTTLLKGDATDPLVQFTDHYRYWQLIAVSFFFHKHWGIAFNYQAGYSKSMAKKDGQFKESIESQYGKDYYISPFTLSHDDDPIFLGEIQQGYLGVIYRLESNRFFIYPKLAIGISSFYTNRSQIFLKQKNANDVIEINYLPNKLPHDHFTLAPSAAMGYKISKRIYINLNVQGSFYKTNFTYTQTTTDLNSGQSTTELIPYKRKIGSLGLGAGLIIVLDRSLH